MKCRKKPLYLKLNPEILKILKTNKEKRGINIDRQIEFAVKKFQKSLRGSNGFL